MMISTIFSKMLMTMMISISIIMMQVIIALFDIDWS